MKQEHAMTPGVLVSDGQALPSDLTEALRQYRHNNSNALVFGYDKDMTERYVAGLIAAAPAPAERVEQEPIYVEAVARTKENKNGFLFLDWLIEGGITALESPGVTLLVAHGNVTDQYGRGEIYTAPRPSPTPDAPYVLCTLEAALRSIAANQLPDAYQRIGEVIAKLSASPALGTELDAEQYTAHDRASQAANTAKALRSANWAGVNVGNKALIASAIQELEAPQPSPDVAGLVEALKDITDDYEGRFDIGSPSTNPGIKIVVAQARAALSAHRQQED